MSRSLTAELVPLDKSPLHAVGFTPYYLQLAGLNNGHPFVDGTPHYDLASNDYLGLASERRVKEAMASAISQYGSSMCGTPIATGYLPLLPRLECELAEFVGVEDVVVLPSCYQANMVLFPAIAGREDLVVVDHYAHASLGQGIKASGCRIQPFLHNNLAHLEKILSTCRKHRHVFVVTESVFSTEGAVAPLRDIIRLCQLYSAIPVVDDSHGIGVLGARGGGILREFELPFDGIYTASLGKALAQSGGIIGGSRDLIEGLRYTCPGLIYSTALIPACVAGTLQALEVIRNEFTALRERLTRHHQQLAQRLGRCGFALTRGTAPIASITCGSTQATLALAKHFFDHHILTTPFVPPSVPPGEGILRLIVGAKFTDAVLTQVLDQVQPFVDYRYPDQARQGVAAHSVVSGGRQPATGIGI